MTALFCGAPGHAAALCVNSVAGLNFALTASQDNRQNDQIDIVAGSYALNASGLPLVSSEANSLTFFGGYNADCSQLTTAVTSLNGGSINQVLRVIPSSAATAASIHIERIAFITGKTSVDGGGGLFATAQSGEVRIESNCFLLNHAENYAESIHASRHGLKRNCAAVKPAARLLLPSPRHAHLRSCAYQARVCRRAKTITT